MSTPRTCPSCGARRAHAVGFCESCGVRLDAVDAAPGLDEPTVPLVPWPRRPAGRGHQRDHVRESPAPWVAGISDRGLVHHRNEDALALLATGEPGGRAVLVVLDGVSSSVDSDVASAAGAAAARESLGEDRPEDGGSIESGLRRAVEAAQHAIVASTASDSPHPAAATIACAVVQGRRVVAANVGDSRVYWLPDVGEPVRLTVDDSTAEELVASGVARHQAETGPLGHTITRWLGARSRHTAPRLNHLDAEGDGWVVACTDGLWNYASEPAELAARVRALPASTAPDLASALVAFANDAGGHDNITVALARIESRPGQQASLS